MKGKVDIVESKFNCKGLILKKFMVLEENTSIKFFVYVPEGTYNCGVQVR
jgi:hypothetical protein